LSVELDAALGERVDGVTGLRGHLVEEVPQGGTSNLLILASI